MQHFIYIQAADLYALLPLAGKNDKRVYLNGIKVEAAPNKTRLVATDGTVLGVLEREAEKECPNVAQGGYAECIIPRKAIERLPKPGRDSKIVALTLTGPAGGKLSSNGTDVTFSPIDARYPEYERLFNTPPSGELAQFSLDLLAKFATAAKRLQRPGSAVQLQHNGTEGARITIDELPEFAGIIAPMHAKVPHDTQWARHSLAKALAKEAA